jgi:hypothetical protein
LNLDFCLDMQKKKDRCYWALKINFETERKVSVPVQILSYLFYKNKQTVTTRNFFEITSITPLSHSHLDECNKDTNFHIVASPDISVFNYPMRAWSEVNWNFATIQISYNVIRNFLEITISLKTGELDAYSKPTVPIFSDIISTSPP